MPNFHLSKEETKALMDEITDVLHRHIHLQYRVMDSYLGEPNEWDDKDESYEYDSDSPKYIDGIVLVVAVGNLSGDHNLTVHAPVGQSPYLTSGMLMDAGPLNL